MTLERIKDEMILRTEQKIDEIKTRQFDVPKSTYKFTRLYRSLAAEIHGYALKQVGEIIDRNHIRIDTKTVIAFIEKDLNRLVGQVPRILASKIGG